MKMTDNQQSNRDYQQDERQRKAIHIRLDRMIDELDGRPADRRRYQPFPIGVLEKAIEKSLQGLEDLVRSLVTLLRSAYQNRGTNSSKGVGGISSNPLFWLIIQHFPSVFTP